MGSSTKWGQAGMHCDTGGRDIYCNAAARELPRVQGDPASLC